MKKLLNDTTVAITADSDDQMYEAVDTVVLPVTTGVCTFCGQVHHVTNARYQSDADDMAATKCDCDDGEDYRRELRRAKTRQQDLEKAGKTIDELFGSMGYEGTVALLKDAATMVYDSSMESITVGVTTDTRAKITRSSKGNLTIERKDTTSSKLEI